MKACMVATDTPGHTLACCTVEGAAVVELSAALVPKLITSTGANGGIAVVAGPVGQRASSKGFSLRSWAREDALRGKRVWLCEPRHECQQLGIPQRERVRLVRGHCCAEAIRYVKSWHCVSGARWTFFWAGAERIPRKLRAADKGAQVASRGQPSFIASMPDDRALSRTRGRGVDSTI